jgi:ABC-type transport system substrate-binding protein
MLNAARVSGPLVILAVALAIAPAAAQAPGPVVREGKPGGVLRPVLREDLPQGFAVHETATNSVTWPAMPCYSNLVVYDQTKRLGRMDTIVPELAEKWSRRTRRGPPWAGGPTASRITRTSRT